MPLLITGKEFKKDLEKHSSMAFFAPLEGGYETRLLRRMRSFGYKTHITSARGLGDPEVFLFQLHGVRPPHLGHQNIGRNGALGEVHQVLPQASNLFLDKEKKKLLWILEGQVLTPSELESIIAYTSKNQLLKIVIEMGGARKISWEPLSTFLEKL
tara:strand:- start:7557 stop:8024 length:468 start_codon:yes stop_codon:yes gene_type:complete